LQNCPFGKLCYRRDGLEHRILVCSNEWKPARCAHRSAA
jgi:hypothetical protein